MSVNQTQKVGTVLCPLLEIDDPGSRSFDVLWEGEQVEMFVVHKDGKVFGYLNRCPHTGGPLDWRPNEFLDLDQQYIQCATHDALFRIRDGRCLAGPCAGDALTTIPVCELDGQIVLQASSSKVVD